MLKLRLKEHCSCQEVGEENSRYLSQAKISLPSPCVMESVSRAGNNLRKLFSLPFPLWFPHECTEAIPAVEIQGQSPAWVSRAVTGAPLRLPRQRCPPELRVGLPKPRRAQRVPRGKGRWVVLSWMPPGFVPGWAEGRLKGRAPSLLGRWEPSWEETDDFLSLN